MVLVSLELQFFMLFNSLNSHKVVKINQQFQLLTSTLHFPSLKRKIILTKGSVFNKSLQFGFLL